MRKQTYLECIGYTEWVFLSRLKQETLPQHVAIERQIDLKRVCGSRAAYAAHLARLYGFYYPLEEVLWRTHAAREAELGEERRKTPLLFRDLTALEIDPRILPLCPALPPLVDDSQAMGCLYVLEGASLGGQVITRIVAERLGITAQSGGAFFYGYGSETAAMWESFRSSLADYAQDQGRQDAVIRSAAATFDALGNWIASGKGNC